MSDVTDLKDKRYEREAETRAFEVFVERESDAECANRTWFFIRSESREAVAIKIAALLAEVESFGNGYGTFDGPYRASGVYFATGHTVSYP